MHDLWQIYKSFDPFVVVGSLLLLGLAAVLVARTRLGRRLREATRGGAGSAGEGDWKMGRKEWLLVGLLAGFSVALVVTDRLDNSRAKREKNIIEQVDEALQKSRLRQKEDPSSWVHSVAEARLKGMGVDIGAAERAGMDECSRLETEFTPLIPASTIAPLEGVKRAGYWRLPVIGLLWLVLGVSYLMLVNDHARARAAVLAGGGAAGPPGRAGTSGPGEAAEAAHAAWAAQAAAAGAGRRGFALWTGMCLWLLAGSAIFMAAREADREYVPSSTRRNLMEIARLENADAIRHKWLKGYMTRMADEMDAKRGHRVITPEQREAFLAATRDLPKTWVQVLPPGPPVTPPPTRTRRSFIVAPGLDATDLAVQGLVFEAGYTPGAFPVREKADAVQLLVDALLETGIVPGVEPFTVPENPSNYLPGTITFKPFKPAPQVPAPNDK